MIIMKGGLKYASCEIMSGKKSFALNTWVWITLVSFTHRLESPDIWPFRSETLCPTPSAKVIWIADSCRFCLSQLRFWLTLFPCNLWYTVVGFVLGRCIWNEWIIETQVNKSLLSIMHLQLRQLTQTLQVEFECPESGF